MTLQETYKIQEIIHVCSFLCLCLCIVTLSKLTEAYSCIHETSSSLNDITQSLTSHTETKAYSFSSQGFFYKPSGALFCHIFFPTRSFQFITCHVYPLSLVHRAIQSTPHLRLSSSSSSHMLSCSYKTDLYNWE